MQGDIWWPKTSRVQAAKNGYTVCLSVGLYENSWCIPWGAQMWLMHLKNCSVTRSPHHDSPQHIGEIKNIGLFCIASNHIGVTPQYNSSDLQGFQNLAWAGLGEVVPCSVA